ncbi:hypothetical protein ACFQ8C_18280 [Streptomyces sp. NPDC056503]|uniref:hypothetical protein n=1 Tax=Streptomyces sp. NPDC056503 TaxID=3345842 RepID=UPI0036B8AB8B
MTRPRSPLRALRAALFAVVCVVLAAVGHSSMSDHPLAPRTLLAAFAATAAVAWCAAGRRRGPVACATGTLTAQGALHLVFSLTGAHPGGAPGTASPAGRSAGAPQAAHAGHPGHADPSAHLGHASHGGTVTDTAAPDGLLLPDGLVAPDGLVTPDGLADLLAPAVAGGGGMLAVHLLAALVCGVWLARGEAAFFALAEGTFRPLRRLFAVPSGPVAVPSDPRRPVRRPRRDARRPRAVVLAHVLSRRGPPRPPVPRATVLGPLV